MGETICVVEIRFGEFLEEYYYSPQFCTFDACYADEWVEKYNRIIENNRERLVDYDFKESHLYPLYYNTIVYEFPVARVKTLEFR